VKFRQWGKCSSLETLLLDWSGKAPGHQTIIVCHLSSRFGVTFIRGFRYAVLLVIIVKSVANLERLEAATRTWIPSQVMQQPRFNFWNLRGLPARATRFHGHKFCQSHVPGLLLGHMILTIDPKSIRPAPYNQRQAITPWRRIFSLLRVLRGIFPNLYITII